jgi:hypothetical protein
MSRGKLSHTNQPIQMMPAEPGWRACFWEDDDHKQKQVGAEDVIMWCLCEPLVATSESSPWKRDGTETNGVEGFIMTDTGIESAELISNFAGYVPPKCEPESQPWWPDEEEEDEDDEDEDEEKGRSRR